MAQARLGDVAGVPGAHRRGRNCFGCGSIASSASDDHEVISGRLATAGTFVFGGCLLMASLTLETITRFPPRRCCSSNTDAKPQDAKEATLRRTVEPGRGSGRRAGKPRKSP